MNNLEIDLKAQESVFLGGDTRNILEVNYEEETHKFNFKMLMRAVRVISSLALITSLYFVIATKSTYSFVFSAIFIITTSVSKLLQEEYYPSKKAMVHICIVSGLFIILGITAFFCGFEEDGIAYMVTAIWYFFFRIN